MKETEALLSELQDRSKSSYVPEFYLACMYAAMNRKDEAFELLNKAFEDRANGMSGLKTIPLVDDLRSDPRFGKLLKRLNLD